MSHDDEDVLAPVDLHAWRVPPPPALDRASLVARVLAPAAAPRRARTSWALAALAFVNVVLAALVVIVISQWPSRSTVAVQPAGGGGGDAQTQTLLRRLEQEQRELERRLADIQQLRRVVEALSERVDKCEQAATSDAPGPKPRRDVPVVAESAPCDEVSCVLSNYEGTCCDKFRPARTRSPAPSALPEFLGRNAVATGIAAVRPEITACGRRAAATVTVKVRVHVSPAGRVARALVDGTVDPLLGECVIAAISKATFERTQRGGSFSYPFAFLAPPPVDPFSDRNP
jgi:hypothetical protein